MATYIPGVQDYIPQIQPFKPDFNFLGNMLQTKQSRYDAGYNQLSNLYGTLLNSPMLREENVAKRDEFFKSIEGNIQKISGLDLSLEQNVDIAKSVFKGFYEDKDIIKDMTWTKNYYNQKQRSEAMRNCIDPDKCGGKWWEGGDKYLDYKAQEFKNASKEDALNFGNINYIAAQDFQGKAVKAAKDAGFNVKYDTVKGDWIVTTVNGTEMVKPLSEFYMSTYGNDPAMMDFFKAQSYTSRKDWVASNLNAYGSEDEANMAYVQQYYNQINKTVEDGKSQAKVNSDIANQKSKDIDRHIKENGVLDSYQDWINSWGDMKSEAADADTTVKTYEDASNSLKLVKENSQNMKAYLSYFDGSAALDLLKRNSLNAASQYATLTSENTFRENPVAKAYRDHAWDVEKTRSKEGYIDPRTNEYVPGTDVRGQMMMKEYEEKVKKEAEKKAAEEKKTFTEGWAEITGDQSTDVDEKLKGVNLNKAQIKNSMDNANLTQKEYSIQSIRAMQNLYAKDQTQGQSMTQVLNEVFAGYNAAQEKNGKPKIDVNKILNGDTSELNRLNNLNLIDSDNIARNLKRYTNPDNPTGAVYSKWFDPVRKNLLTLQVNADDQTSTFLAVSKLQDEGKTKASNELLGKYENEIKASANDPIKVLELQIAKDALSNSSGFAGGSMEEYAKNWAQKNQKMFQSSSIGYEELYSDSRQQNGAYDAAYDFAYKALEKSKIEYDGLTVYSTNAWDAMDPNSPSSTNAKTTKTAKFSVNADDISTGTQNANDLRELLLGYKKSLAKGEALVQFGKTIDPDAKTEDNNGTAIKLVDQLIADLSSSDKDVREKAMSEVGFSRIARNKYGESLITLSVNENFANQYKSTENKSSLIAEESTSYQDGIAIIVPSTEIADSRVYKVTSPSTAEFRLKRGETVEDNIPGGGRATMLQVGNSFVFKSEFDRILEDGSIEKVSRPDKRITSATDLEALRQSFINDASDLAVDNKQRLDAISKRNGKKDPNQVFNK
jgi:hypothetical protein